MRTNQQLLQIQKVKTGLAITPARINPNQLEPVGVVRNGSQTQRSLAPFTKAKSSQ